MVDVPIHIHIPTPRDTGPPPSFKFYPKVYARRQRPHTLSTETHDQVPAGSTSSNSLNIPSTSLSNNLSNIFIPTTFEEASKHAVWMTVMREEMDALACNNTWVLTSLPEGKN